MILKEYAEWLKKNKEKAPIEGIIEWLKLKIEKPAKNNVEKIIQKEIYIGKNKKGCYIFIGRSETGRKLIEELYNFSLSVEEFKRCRKLHENLLKKSNKMYKK